MAVLMRRRRSAAGFLRREGRGVQTRSNRGRNTITKYTLLALAGLVAFVLLSCHFYGVRGYKAVGGEVFALLLPVLYYVLGKTVRDIFTTEEGG